MSDKSAEKQVDAKIIKKTQDALGKIIKKPPLTDKLLQKPPFRFLHDVITAVVKQTGFMKGLFTELEMNSENVKEKDAKIAFLQKVVDMVSLVIAKPISAKPAKIIAGHDADKTNELLQALVEAINKKIDNDDYVRRVLKTEDSSKPPPAARKESKESSRSKDKEESSKKPREKSVDVDDKEKSSGDRHRSRDREASKDKDTDSRNNDKRDKERDERHRSRSDAPANDSEKSKGDQSRGDRREKKDDSSDEQKLQRPTSAKGSRRHQSRDELKKDESKREDSKRPSQVNNADDDSRQSTAKKSIRPSSSRPAPPKPKKNDISSEEPVVLGGRKVPNVIVDKKDNSDDDDDNENDENENDFLNSQTQQNSGIGRPEMNGNEDTDDTHGGLVKKILDAKKEAEQQPGKKTEIDRSQVVSDASRRKERDAVQRDIDRLRGSVQTLTRSVNPLGKILDFVQEDFDAMQKELDVWRRENRENVVALQREQSVTESSIEPLKAQLSELDSAIRDQLDLIAAVKSTILHNDLKVTKMLGSVTKS